MNLPDRPRPVRHVVQHVVGGHGVKVAVLVGDVLGVDDLELEGMRAPADFNTSARLRDD